MEEQNISPVKTLLFGLVKRAKADMEHRFTKSKIGITPLQYGVLCVIKEEPATINELARKMIMRPPSLVPVVDALEKFLFLERKKDTRDRRKIHLVITERGTKVLKRMRLKKKDDALDNAFRKLKKEEQTRLLSLLEILTRKFGK